MFRVRANPRWETRHMKPAQCESTMQSHSAEQTAAVRRVTWVGMILNVLLSAFKVAAGVIGHSQAVVADGVHSLSDTMTDVAILIGVRYWSAPPDETHPHGHSRIETVITVFIGLILAGVAVGLGRNAIVTLTSRHGDPPGVIALVAALVSIVSKEAIYRWTVIVGRRAKSPALVANAWHHRSDGLSSIPAAIAVAVAQFFPQWYFLDHVGAIIVTIFILQAAWSIAWPALKELTDAGADPESCAEIQAISLSVPGVKSVHKIRTRKMGYGLAVDLHVQVDAALSVQEGHNISETVKRLLRETGPDVVDVITHLEPFEDAGAGQS